MGGEEGCIWWEWVREWRREGRGLRKLWVWMDESDEGWEMAGRKEWLKGREELLRLELSLRKIAGA